MNSDSRKFWMVLGEGVPTFRHYTLAAAKSEAERLARTNPGQTFIVLEAVESVKKSDVQWIDLLDFDQIPF